jgi:hypothetical protein
MQSCDDALSGFITSFDFGRILLNFCPELNEDELEYLSKKHTNQADGLYDLF